LCIDYLAFSFAEARKPYHADIEFCDITRRYQSHA
jgi:hypothetical protein